MLPSPTIIIALLCIALVFGSIGHVHSAASNTFPGQEDTVKSLPGLNFATNYHQYSGYLESDNGTYLHYWFFESQSGQSAKDPVILWLNGGPGCSSMLGALTELGPLYLTPNGTLIPNPYSWTGKANILFLESPAGVGFSYRLNVTGENYTTRVYKTSDKETAVLNLSALRSFYQKFPQFAQNNFYIAGESYAGIYIPTLASLLIGEKFPQNFRGVAIGNGLLNEDLLGSSLIHFGYHHALIDKPVYQEVLRKCCATQAQFELEKCNIVKMDQSMECLLARGQATDKLRFFSPINPYNIYKKCIRDQKVAPFVSVGENRIHPDLVHRQLMMSTLGQKVSTEEYFDSNGAGGSATFRSSPPCVDFDYLEKWINLPEIQKALNIHVNLSRAWVPCSFDVSLLYERQYTTVKSEIINLVNAGKKVLIYNGDVDSVCNFIGDQWFVEDLGYKVVHEYGPWMFGDQVAGFTKVYEKNLTFTTIRGAGHTVPEDKPAEALKMFNDFISL